MEEDKPNSMTLNEANERYPRFWLMVKVVNRDKESGQPLQVEVLSKALDSFSLSKSSYQDNVCTMYTGPIPEIDHLLML